MMLGVTDLIGGRRQCGTGCHAKRDNKQINQLHTGLLKNDGKSHLQKIK
jgi:hypothetical protein